MRISTKGRYAVTALFDLSVYGKGKPLTAKEIAKRQSISLFYLENIFLKLKRAGLVRAVKGPRGGFLLTKDPKQITIGEIIRATEGPVALVKCLLSVSACKKSGCCATRKLWQNLSYKFSELMDSITLADLIRGKKR